MITGRISSVQRASIHDGPGVRTTVFLKGCPLSCAWCHNPECISYEIESLFYADKCIGCGRCAEGCYAGARVPTGRDVTPEELLEEIERDRPYYALGGGVTFSGGEPLMQREFLFEAVKACKERGIHVALETSMYLYDEKILSLVDYIMCDIKIFDSDLHRKYTGVFNERILENIRKADKLCKPLVIRTPVIMEIDQGFDEIFRFVCSLDSVIKYELLPYHPLGEDKARALGREPVHFSVPTKEYMEEIRKKYAYLP